MPYIILYTQILSVMTCLLSKCAAEEWCSGAGTHGNGVPTYEIEWEWRSHKRNFERYLFIIAIN